MRLLPLNRVVKLAVAALLQQRHAYAFDRNMFVGGYKTPHTENCNKKYDEISQAIFFLKALVPVDPPGQEDPVTNQQSEISNQQSEMRFP